jgi:hypothetical protein
MNLKMLTSAALIGSMSISAGALADQGAADACAAKLSGDSAAIYAAAKAKGPTAANWQSIVQGTTRELAQAGRIDRSKAMNNGTGAAQCIRLGLGMETAETKYHWTAAITLGGGVPRNCGDQPYPTYNVEVMGTWMRAIPLQGESQFVRNVMVDLSPLNADGSGRITVRTPLNVVWLYEFEAGNGLRRIFVRQADGECVFVWTPK